jgi:hypothetical protein
MGPRMFIKPRAATPESASIPSLPSPDAVMRSFFALLSLGLAAIARAEEHSLVRGVVVLARNGDRFEYFQDPITYRPFQTEATALGAVRVVLFFPSSAR